MLKKLTENLKNRKIEKERNKEQFELNNLYVGEIILFKKSVPVRKGVNNNYYTYVKKVAIFTTDDHKAYKHVKSGQILWEMGKNESIVGDFAVINLKKFPERFPIYMRKNDLNKSTLVSQAFIETFEEEKNLELAPDQKVDELFL